MKCTLDSIDRLPELPLELLELSGKLSYSERAPVLTIKPDRLPIPDRPAGATLPQKDRSGFAIRQYITFVYYPLVFCYLPNDETVATLRIENQDSGLVPTQSNIDSISRSRRYYKLSRFHGRALIPSWVCVWNFGPHGAYVEEVESCDGAPSKWTLYAVEPDIELKWNGTREDIPSFPNLNVDMGTLWAREVTRHCCPGFKWCATTMSCIPSHRNCPDAVPA